MKKIVLAMLLVAAVTAVAQTAAAPAQPARRPVPHPLRQRPEKRDQRSSRIQRLRGRRAANGCCGQGQRPGSVSDAISQQRDERRRAGTFDGRLPADGQPGQDAGHGGRRFWQANPCNIRALALLAYTKQAMADGRPERGRRISPKPARTAKRACSVCRRRLSRRARPDCGLGQAENADAVDFQRRGWTGRFPGQGLRQGRDSICGQPWKPIRRTC